MAATAQSVHAAADVIETIHTPLTKVVREATQALVQGGAVESEAVARVSALLIAEVGRVLSSAAAEAGRSPDSRTFEAMFDLNGVVDHFQASLAQGMRIAAKSMEKDGYNPAAAWVLAASRALDAVADIVKTR